MIDKDTEQEIVLPQKDINEVEEYVKELKAEKEKKTEKKKTVELPEFLLPQFKTVEEQAKSYKELQALQTRQAQELAKYKKNEEILLQQDRKQDLKKNILKKEEELRQFYIAEAENINRALHFGKITQQEAVAFMDKLKNFMKMQITEVVSQYKTTDSYVENGENSDMVSPKEYFANFLEERNYFLPISEFLESNYKKMSKKELENVKNLVSQLESSLREEILNEKSLKNANENYRKGLNSTTNLNNQPVSEKVFTLAEIKNMKPEEFRKNQKLILEQFTARKIK